VVVSERPVITCEGGRNFLVIKARPPSPAKFAPDKDDGLRTLRFVVFEK
jgi:hypothetical protein